MPRPNSPVPAKLVKGNLPTKQCAVCGRPFEYRKKWRNCWDEVKYCGEKCQRNKNRPPDGASSVSGC